MWFGKLDISILENWLWEAACSIRGSIDAPKYKDYIIPLISHRRFRRNIEKISTERSYKLKFYEKVVKEIAKV